MHVLVQAFFEDAAAQVVGLAFHGFLDCLTKFAVRNASFARGF
jgi:hypothetical protein